MRSVVKESLEPTVSLHRTCNYSPPDNFYLSSRSTEPTNPHIWPIALPPPSIWDSQVGEEDCIHLATHDVGAARMLARSVTFDHRGTLLKGHSCV